MLIVFSSLCLYYIYNSMKKLKSLLRLLRNISSEGIDKLNANYETGRNFNKNACHPPGDGYSAIISVDEVKQREQQIWGPKKSPTIAGIDLNEKTQLALISEFQKYYADIPFTAQPKDGLRYYFENNWYSYSDGILLYSAIRHFKPERIIEIGSGYSSAMMLDMKELFDNKLDLTFIEPDPERLYSLLKPNDKAENKFIISSVQDVDIAVFKELQENDILFIDSSHVSKTGSDINRFLFDVLPVLNKGVLIHFHDIFYPFEYPKEWVYKGQNWNEDYILRAFLMYNSAFEIKIFSDYLHTHQRDVFKNMPLCYEEYGGNIWIQKL